MKKVNDDKIPEIQCPMCMFIVKPKFFTNSNNVNIFHYEHICHRTFTAEELDKMEKK